MEIDVKKLMNRVKRRPVKFSWTEWKLNSLPLCTTNYSRQNIQYISHLLIRPFNQALTGYNKVHQFHFPLQFLQFRDYRTE